MRFIVKCSATWCGAIQKEDPSLKFFRFPSEDNQFLYDAWAIYSGNQRLIEGRCKQAWLCQVHFASPAFKNEQDLLYNAVPSIPPPQISVEVEVEPINTHERMDLKTEDGSEGKIYVAPITSILPNNLSLETFNNQFSHSVSSPVQNDNEEEDVEHCLQRKRKHTIQNTGTSLIDDFTPPKKRLYETIVKRIVR